MIACREGKTRYIFIVILRSKFFGWWDPTKFRSGQGKWKIMLPYHLNILIQRSPPSSSSGNLRKPPESFSHAIARLVIPLTPSCMPWSGGYATFAADNVRHS